MKYFQSNNYESQSRLSYEESGVFSDEFEEVDNDTIYKWMSLFLLVVWIYAMFL